MAPTKTTTLRLSTDLRDEIARLADEHKTSMVDVVASAIAELKRQYWWNEVHSSLDELDDSYHQDAHLLESTTSDGLVR